MPVELRRFEPSEREIHFSRWISENGIRRFLFDLDDTICVTRPVFRSAMAEATKIIALHDSRKSQEQWMEELDQIDSKLFELHGVNPNRWNVTVDTLAEIYSLDRRVVATTKQILQNIYLTPLVMKEGSQEGLDFLVRIGVPIGIVTHASFEWTRRKFEWLKLNRYIDWDELYLVDENGQKTSKSWAQAIHKFRLTPKDCAVVGDSPRSDINPACEIGVKHCFMVENNNRWEIHNQPVDQRVKVINGLNEIAEVVLGG